MEIEILVDAGNILTWHRTLHGTRRSGMMGIPPSKKKIIWNEMIVSRFEEDKIAEEWLARSQNRFFSSVVRIQKDRGHVVCDKGLYEIVRHPGYFGMIISLTALPFITTSVWSIIPVLIAIILLIIRTSLEDETLINELEGYVSYTKITRYKLIPYIW